MNLLRKNLSSNSNGQIAIIVLLLMSITLTATLFLLSRSTYDIKISKETEESTRAFHAAEAGIEEALGNLQITSGTALDFGEGSSAEYSVSLQPSLQRFIFPETIEKDDVQQIWFVSHDQNGEVQPCSPTFPCYDGSVINICWGESGAEITALEAAIIYQSAGTYHITRRAWDRNSAVRGDNFSLPDGDGSSGNCGQTLSGNDFADYAAFDFSGLPAGSQVILARIRLIFNNEPQPLAILSDGINSLPAQGYEIESTGHAGETQRKVRVFRSYPSLSGLFDFALFSGNNLVKQ